MIIQSLSQQEDKASIESDYTSDTSSLEETTISRNTVIDCNENSLCPQSHEFEDISKLSQLDSWECFSGAKITDVGCRNSASLNDALLVNDSLIMNSASLDQDTSHFDSCGLVDSLDKMTVEESPGKYVSIGTQTITDIGANGVSVLLSDNAAHEEKDVNDKPSLSAENNHPVAKLKEEKTIKISVKDLENCSGKLGRDFLQLLFNGFKWWVPLVYLFRWIAKHFDRVLSTKGFATLPSTLQEDLLVEIKKNFVISGSIEILNQCDKLSCCTPLVKWTEPIHVAVSSIQESCLLFISNNFLSVVDEETFHQILKGVGWSIPVLEKIICAVKKHFTIENCCDQLRAILRLKRLMKVKTLEESEDYYPKEVNDLVTSLHHECVKFMKSNLFKVTRSQGWKNLKITTQREVKEEPKSRCPLILFLVCWQSLSKSTPSRVLSQRLGPGPSARGLGRGTSATQRQPIKRSNPTRPASSSGCQSKGPSSSAENGVSSSSSTSTARKTSVSSKDVSKRRASSSSSSATSETSKSSSSFAKNNSDKRPSNAEVLGKTLSPKSSSNGLTRTRQTSGKAPVSATPNAKKKRLSTLGNPKDRSSCAAGSIGTKNSQAVSRPSLPRSKTDSSLPINLKHKNPVVRFSEDKTSSEDPRPSLPRSKTDTTLARKWKESNFSSGFSFSASKQRQASCWPSLPRCYTDIELSKTVRGKTPQVEGSCTETKKALNRREQVPREASSGVSSSSNSNKLSSSTAVKDSSRRKVLFKETSSSSTRLLSKDSRRNSTSHLGENDRS
ncbi:PREDICTED: uncharacterized protein KIAA1107-like [Acropora digitifera]|uniref:uncharacterized protein KIAA1107-like n=1 Tax=Acropora digitifera TaxID=70779 RepID=UPI00077A9AAC|nr:PREDICTED: uncharacterized protein KIAA1107-like [Acropora digitifera]